MKNILIPTDFSQNSWNAIEYALDFFNDLSCNIYLLHINIANNFSVGEVAQYPSKETIENIYLKPSKERLHNTISKLKTVSKNTEHHFFTLTDYGYFIDSIRNQVEEKQIDLIVMGTKGASGIKKLLIGSNTADVITKVACTTLVIPENSKFNIPYEIAFPTDFSLFYSIETLRPLTEILEMHHASIRLLYVRNKKEEQLTNEQIKNQDYLADYFSEIHQSFHYLTNKNLDDAIQCFVQSRDIQLIAMVAKNLNFFQQILFRPTIEEITYHTDIPFLVLHK